MSWGLHSHADSALRSGLLALAADHGSTLAASALLRAAVLLAGEVQGWKIVAGNLSGFQDQIAAYYGAGLIPPVKLRDRAPGGQGGAA